MVLHEEGHGGSHGPVFVLFNHGPLSETTLWELFVQRMSGSLGQLVLLECPSLVCSLRHTLHICLVFIFNFFKQVAPELWNQ